MKIGKAGAVLLKVNVFFFLILKGALVISICMDAVIRREATEHFGFNPIYIGVVGIITGSALIAWINERVRKGVWG